MKPRYVTITLLYMACIILFSLKPDTNSYHGNSKIIIKTISNLMHIPLYGLLTYLLLRCFSSLTIKTYIIAFITATLFGIANEVIQHFVPGRSMSLLDVALNTLGVIAGMRMRTWHS